MARVGSGWLMGGGAGLHGWVESGFKGAADRFVGPGRLWLKGAHRSLVLLFDPDKKKNVPYLAGWR